MKIKKPRFWNLLMLKARNGEGRKKLPSGWRHWCREANLHAHARNQRDNLSWFYLKGRGRYWRVNCNYTLDMSEVYDTFDRWANSILATVPMPKTKAEFFATIHKLESLSDGK